MQIGLLCIDMKKLVFTLLILALARFAYAGSVFFEGFEYANHDGESPIGWTCDDNSWMTGYLAKDHNRTPYNGNWYAYTEGNDSWMFMELFMNLELKYRYQFWAISDGEFDVEIWAGDGPSVSQMTNMLCVKNVNCGEYEFFSEYIQTLPQNYQYFGIHATAHEGAYYLTIDDFQVNMVDKYSIAVDPDNFYTYAAPGSQVEFRCVFSNLGYEPANVLVSFISEHFTNMQLFIDGTPCTTFHVEPDETVNFTGVGTLTPNIEIGELGWVDIYFTLDCNCATAMSTVWATASVASVDEYSYSSISIYPNPSRGMLNIEGTGVVTISNVLGQEIFKKQIIDKEIVTLEKGIYFVKKDNDRATKIIVE